MLIHKTHLMVNKVASDEACRPQLNAVHIFTKDGETHAQATDGHRLLRVSRPSESDADFPRQADTPSVNLEGAGAVIPAKACADALKAYKKHPAIPMLANNARLEQSGSDVAFVTTDLDTTSRVQAKPIDYPYPNTDQAFPVGDPVLRVAVNAEYLKEICDVVCRLHAADGNKVTSELRLTFYSELSAIKLEATLDGGRVVGLLMPLRLAPEHRIEKAA